MNHLIILYDHLYHGVFGAFMKVLPEKEPQTVTGPGALSRLSSVLSESGAKHPMIVTGPRIVQSETFRNAASQIPEYSVFSDVQPDPTIETVEKIVLKYRRENCDSFIAIGGGSNMDAAKAASARIARPDKTLKQMGGTLKVLKKTPLFIAVPTTAGTGSECTVAAVITDQETHHKYAVNDFVLRPDIAILDPELTLSLPAGLTASTGMDALTHAVEAYLNTAYHAKHTAVYSEKAIKAIFTYLPRAYKNPSDLKAREKMLLASYRAGLAFTTACVGNVHAIAHTIGGLYHVPHGLANAVILPIVLRDYGKAVQKPLARLARITGLSDSSTSDEQASLSFIEHIESMNASMGIPDHIDGIREQDIKKMAGWAYAEANPLYPVPVIYDEEHFCRLLRRIGRL